MKIPALTRLTLGLSLASLPCAAGTIEAALDVSKRGAPINPFIYGQFIEHMGRCIYGGIYAEMLEDRKFYFPITAEYSPYRGIDNPDFPGQLVGGDFPVVGASPWQVFGENGSVTMVTDAEHVFVGRHVPKLASGTGIRQLDLGVVAGKACEGYIWAKPSDGSAELEVSLVWGNQPDQRASETFAAREDGFTKFTFSFTPGMTLDRKSVV